MSRTTLELAADAAELIQALNACETDDEAYALLEVQLDLEAALTDKLERLHAVQRRAEAERALLREEETRLAARRRRSERAAERASELARIALEVHRDLTGESRVVTSTLTARLQRSPRRLVAPTDPRAWPEAYVVHEPKLDREALKADLERGADVTGCALLASEHVRWS